MNDHQKAQRWINARMDGALAPQDARELEQHLQTCGECRQYADQILHLDGELQQAFAIRRQSEQRHSLPVISLPPRAGSPATPMRAPMNRTNLLSGFFRTAIYIAALAGLTAGLVFLFSSQFRPPVSGALQPTNTATAYPAQTEAAPYPYPGTGDSRPYPAAEGNAYPGSQAGSPYPAATGTPYPSTGAESYPAPQAAYPGAEATTTPVYPPSDIIPVLQDLAEKNAAWYRQAGWLYSLENNTDREGTIPVPSLETWYQAPQSDTQCARSLRLSEDQPQGQVVYQMLVTTADGLSGDPQELRGIGQPIPQLKPGDPGCMLTPEQTPAGYLALRLAEDPSVRGKMPNDVKQARVWSEQQESGSVVVVEVIFEGASQPPLMIETRTFDAESGLLLRMLQRREWEDGRLFSQIETHTSYQVYETLPPDTARQIAQAEEALRALLNPPNLATPMSTGEIPEFKPLPNLDELTYTQDAPSTDPDETLRILNALQQRSKAWLAQPGWYLTSPLPGTGAYSVDNYTLLHVLENGQCEQITYYQPADQFSVTEVRLSDGSWAAKLVEEQAFTQGGRDGEACTAEAFDSVRTLEGEISNTISLSNDGITYQPRVWIENRDGRRVIVIQENAAYATYPMTIEDPDTKSLVHLDRAIDTDYYDLETGNWLGRMGVFYLANGKVIDQTRSQPFTRQYQSFTSLPADLERFYQETLQALQAYLAHSSL